MSYETEGAIMARGMPGFFDIDARLRGAFRQGDDLERIKAMVDFEMFRPDLEAAVPRAERLKGGRPPFDQVLIFKVLILPALYSLSDECAEYQIKDRLSFMRSRASLADVVPNANTIGTFRAVLKKAAAVEGLYQQFDAALWASGFLAMPGQIADATIVAPKQHSTLAEKEDIKDGRAPDGWQGKPAKLAQKDRDALDGQVQQCRHLRRRAA